MDIQNKQMKFADHIFGFTSTGDFAQTFLGLKNWFTVAAISVAGGISSFITSYIYADAKAVFVLVALLILDMMTGIVKSYHKRTLEGRKGMMEFVMSIRSNRLMRGFLVLVFQLLLLAICWNIGTVFPILSFTAGLVYFGLASTQLISISENLYEAKIIKFNLPKQLKDKFKELLSKKKDGDSVDEH